MIKDDNKKKLFIIIIIVLVITLLYFLIRYLTRDDSLEYEEYLKDYEVNEYISTYVSDEDMARIYLNDYIYNMNLDVDESYNLLDEEYRNKKFGSLDAYKEYVNSLELSSRTISKYYKKDTGKYIIFGVYDNNNNFYAFKTNGVMQYSVFLDDYTVEIR